MCTLVILRQPEHPWPLLVAGNRDELRNRPWLPPDRHWEDRREVVAGLDQLAGGSWLGVNDDGVVAVIMNREGSLGPEAGKRSRGELVLEALDHAEATEAAQALADLDTHAYRSFNLFVGDPASAFWLRHRGEDGTPGRVEVFEVPPGLHMLTARDLDDTSTARIRIHLPQFRAAAVPHPGNGDWAAWQTLLASREYSEQDGPHAAMNLDLPNGFGTVCSHLIAIPRYPDAEHRPVFLFAAGPPDRVRFEAVTFG
jgi:uncharacterized protein with NRDE domain